VVTSNQVIIQGIDWDKSFLASLSSSKASKESTFWSDITSRPDGPANHTGSNIGVVTYNIDENRSAKIITHD
jgi:hypothetical protein